MLQTISRGVTLRNAARNFDKHSGLSFLALATAFAMGSSAAAFDPSYYSLSPQQRSRLKFGEVTQKGFAAKSYGPFVFPFFRPAYSVTVCEATPRKIEDGAAGAAAASSSWFSTSAAARTQENTTELPAPVQDELASLLNQKFNGSGTIYERLNPPQRQEEDTHAVGQMLRPNMIERYEIYKNKDNAGTALSSAAAMANCTSSDQPPNTRPVDNNIVTGLLKFGNSLDGHPGIVHGGILALVLDDVFGYSYEAIGVPHAVTANLHLDYRAPVPAGSSVLIHVHLVKREKERKLYFQAEITSLDGTVVYTEASCLYIIPKSVYNSMLVARL
jgi:acyl-coenzyme A thioesterase PaaI-like protein